MREGGREGEVRRIHCWVEGAHEVQKKENQEEKQGIVVEDRECRCLGISHFVLLPRYPVGKAVHCI